MTMINQSPLIETAKALGVRAYRANLWPQDNPFTQFYLREAWDKAWHAENFKEVERIRRREMEE